MDLSNPIRSVVPSAQGEVLQVLARTRESLTGRQVAKMTGGSVSQKSVSNILNRLVESGLVYREEKGKAHLHTLNRDHVAAQAIEELASMNERLIEAITNDVTSWSVRAEGAWIFGSFARGEGGVGSDIDLLIVRPDDVGEEQESWRNQVDELSISVSKWTGNDCRIIEYPLHEVMEMVDNDERLMASIDGDGICIKGDRRLLKSEIEAEA